MESALTLPLAVFLVLGTLQLFMLMQGRAMAQYAVARATRAGSVKFGDCTAMRHTAVAALLPTFTRTTDPSRFVAAFAARKNGRFDPSLDSGRDETIAWIIRESPSVNPNAEEVFDLATDQPITLRVRMVFWYPLRIPFANMVISQIALAHWGLQNLRGANPLLVAQKSANWNDGGSIAGNIGAELLRRARRAHYSLPIQVTYSMRMMTPPRPANFTSRTCSPYP